MIPQPMLYSVREYGAQGDGVNLDTSAIQAAIDACTADAGGTVFVPPGVYRIGTLELKDNVTLHLAADATLLGSEEAADYTLDADKDARLGRHSLIYAEEAKNIALTGQGIIDGQGAAFPCVSRQDSIPAFRGEQKRDKKARKSYFRPMLIIFASCRNVTVTGVTIKDSASWGVHLVACDHVKIDDIKVDNRARPNGDGIDLESCRNVFIANCDISCDDDAICLKSSIADRPVENVVVTNCVISSNCAAVKFGTPSSGGFRKITISNCAFYNCGLGAIKLLSVDGGRLEDVAISNIAMHNVEGPLFIRLGNRGVRFKKAGPIALDDMKSQDSVPVGTLRNILLSGIRATVRNVEVADPMLRVDVDGKAKVGMFITGIPGHPVENVMISDVHITYPGGGTLDDAAIRVPEDEKMYPEQFFFGVLPAYGATIRHARGITFNNVRFELAQPDLRPAVVCEDVQDLELGSFRAEGALEAEAVIRLQEVHGAFIHSSRPLNPVTTFVRAVGHDNDAIHLQANDLRNAKTDLIIDDDMS